jgi:hypothetical protein
MTGPTGPQFDRWGRYLIVPEGGREAVPHTRVTTHAATCDDRYGLEQWGKRMVAIGLSRRPDLLAGVAAARDDDRNRLDSLVSDAIEAGGSSTGRNLGQALHEFTERIDRGELELSAVPDPWQADVAAYRRAMDEAGFSIELVERICVIPELTVAGTFDRLIVRDGHRFVLDVKTAQELRFGWTSISAQLALYSRASTLYDAESGEHTPMPPVDQQVGFVAHVPAGQGTCELIAVDLEVGWRGALLAHQVRSWRKEMFRLGGANNYRPPAPAAESVSLETRRDWLVAEVRRIVAEYPDAGRALAQHWPSGVPTFKQSDSHTDEQLEQIARVVENVNKQYRLPFPDEPDPAIAPPTNRTTERKTA